MMPQMTREVAQINNLGLEVNRLHIISNCCVQLGKKATIGKQDKMESTINSICGVCKWVRVKISF